MSDALLPYYDRELNALRSLAAEFAATHPKIAGRLRLAPESVDDPHVARLLEGVAFLAARVHHRLDDEFPELTDALLGVLYPHYLAPFPSAAIAQFEPQPELTVPLHLPAAWRWRPNLCKARPAASEPPGRCICGRSRSRTYGLPGCRCVPQPIRWRLAPSAFCALR